MIHNNLRLAFRNILHNKGLNSINILGLGIGIVAVLLIFQYIGFEKSYDKYFDNSDRLQRLVFYRYYKTGLDKSVGNNYFLGQIAHEKIPEIENFCRCKRENQYIEAGDQIYKEERTLFADSSYFDMFSHTVVSVVCESPPHASGNVSVSIVSDVSAPSNMSDSQHFFTYVTLPVVSSASLP